MFPHWVALASLGFVLVLFFANTVPALQEQQELRDLASELRDLRRRYDDEIERTRRGLGPRSEYDLQSLLVAIDQLGYTPLELCAAHPRPRPATNVDAPEGAANRRPPATDRGDDRTTR